MATSREKRPLTQTRIPPRLVKDMMAGRCVLFCGAGFSLPATQLSWSGLMDVLRAEVLHIPDSEWHQLDALDQAQLFVDERGRERLEHLLKDAIPGERSLAARLGGELEKPLALRQRLVSLPFSYIFTTNYDALIELLLSRARIPHTVLVDDDQVLVSYPPRLRRVVKVHGDLELSDTIILSRDDYLNYRRLRPGMHRLWQSLLVSHTFLFYGFGLTDPNFRILFHDLMSLMPKDARAHRAYAFMAQESPARVEHWRRRGLHIIESRTFDAQDRKVNTMADRVTAQLQRRDSLSHLLEQLGKGKAPGPVVADGALHPAEEGVLDGGFVARAMEPAEAYLREVVTEMWGQLNLPTPLRNGESSQPRWPGAPLVDVPARKPAEEDRAELLFNTIRLLRQLSPELGALDGAGPLGPPVAVLLGALLYRARRWEEAIEALEEARFWYEPRVRGVPWWLTRMLGRAARRAGDRPSAYEFLLFCVHVATRHAPESVAAGSDASLLMDVALTRVRRLRAHERDELAAAVIDDVLTACGPIIPWLASAQPDDDLYTRRTRGYGSWHLGELILERGTLSSASHHEILKEAIPHLCRAVALLPVRESTKLKPSIEPILTDVHWAPYAHQIHDAIQAEYDRLQSVR